MCFPIFSKIRPIQGRSGTLTEHKRNITSLNAGNKIKMPSNLEQ